MQNKESFNLDESLIHCLGKTMKLIEIRIEDVLAKNNIAISRMQFIILRTIESNQGICQNQLAIFCNRDKSSLTRMINTLIKKGFILKKTAAIDKRKNTLNLSKLGIKIMERATPIIKKQVSLIESELKAEEISSTKEIFTKIQNSLSYFEAQTLQKK